MRVTAAPELRVPMEGQTRKFIDHAPDKPVDVPDNSYYRRRVAAGELVLVAADVAVTTTDEASPAAPASAKETAKPRTKGAS